jgi:hypothetical protein
MVTTITGSTATVRWGYRTVATLTQWTFTKVGQGGTFTAQIHDGDEFGLEQSPLVVVVPAGQAQWRWPVTDLRRDGLRVELTLGPILE